MSTPFKLKGWTPFTQKEDISKIHSESYMESKNIVKGREGVRRNVGGGESTHLMAHSDERMEAWPTLFQDDKGNWYEPPDSYAEAKRRGEVYKFDTVKETRDFAIKGSWKKK